MAEKAVAEKNSDSREISREVIEEANKRVLDDDSLRNIRTLDDAFAALQENNVAAESFSEYGTGFDVLDNDDKGRLVKQPFVILEWKFNKGDFGEYVAALIVTKSNERFVLIDGSTGINKQLADVTMQRLRRGDAKPQQGLLCEKGLRVSEYEYVDSKTGESRPAKTYYLA